MKKAALLGLLLASAFTASAHAQEAYYDGNYLAVAVHTDPVTGAIQPYTEWGRSIDRAEQHALSRCTGYNCYIEASWGNECRFIAYTRYEIVVTESRRSANRFCNASEDDCREIVQRCPR